MVFSKALFFFVLQKVNPKESDSWELFFFFSFFSLRAHGLVLSYAKWRPHHPLSKVRKDMVDLIKWREMSQRGPKKKKGCVWDKVFVKNDFCLDGIC